MSELPGENTRNMLSSGMTRAVVLMAAALSVGVLAGCGSDTPAAAAPKTTASPAAAKPLARIAPAQAPTPKNVPFSSHQEVEAYKQAYKEAFAAAFNAEGSSDPVLRPISDSALKKAMMSGRNAGLQAGKAAKPPRPLLRKGR